ncbi:MAG: ATP synthase F1 subunit delta [bacterium]|nr:ATP synthase F1 subunit delta [bacterium]
MAKTSTKDIAKALYESTKDKSGAELTRLLENAVTFLAKNRLLGKSPEILEHLEKIRDKDLGIVSAKVISKNPLTKHTLDEIKKTLRTRYHASDITLHTSEDSSLIGGITIEANDELIDLSLKNKLHQLQAHLLVN